LHYFYATGSVAPMPSASSQLKVEGPHNPSGGPLLILFREQDQTVPWAIVNASSQEQQEHNAG
jgi:hypothetical protein